MEVNNLKEVLILVGGVYVQNWDKLRKVVQAVTDEKAEIISSQWEDRFRREHPEIYPLRLNKLDTWSTYERCHHLTFTVVEDRLHCHAVIFDGDFYDGYPTKKRFEADFYLPDSFFEVIESSIGYKFNHYILERYEDYLEKKKQDWIKKETKKLLKGNKFKP